MLNFAFRLQNHSGCYSANKHPLSNMVLIMDQYVIECDTLQWHECDKHCNLIDCPNLVQCWKPTFVDQDCDNVKHNPSSNYDNILGSRLQLDYDQLPNKFISTISRFASNSYLHAPLIDKPNRYQPLTNRVSTMSLNKIYSNELNRSSVHNTRRIWNLLSQIHNIYHLFKPTRFTVTDIFELVPASSANQLSPMVD
jgi:hypothetical protein